MSIANILFADNEVSDQVVNYYHTKNVEKMNDHENIKRYMVIFIWTTYTNTTSLNNGIKSRIHKDNSSKKRFLH